MEEELSLYKNDFHKLILLMKEYTEKLRAICEERMEAKFRRIQSSMLLTVIMTIGLSFSFFLIERNADLRQMEFIFFPLSLLIFLGFLFVYRTSSFRYSYDAERVAATVERLIRLASQYNEHARKKVSDSFELDLRIGEAEGALSFYQKVFNVDREWKSQG